MLKIRLLYGFFLLFFVAVIAKLFYLQVLSPTVNADNLYLQTKKIQPERGKIYDRNGLTLAVNKTSYLLFFEPKLIVDKYNFVKRIDDVLHLEEATLEAKIDATKDWVAVKNGITQPEKKLLSSYNLAGLGFEEQSRRYYPEASLAAHLLGFVGKDEKGEDMGYFGIEGFYDKDLSGLPGVLKSERDFLGRPILIGTQEKVAADNGRALYLTIDKSVQDIVKSHLKSGLESYKAKEGCVIVADPTSMQILALSCLPDFDVDKYYTFNESFFKNPAITDLYEPGSTFKPFVLAAALNEKKIKPTDTFREDGPVEVGDYSIRTWNNQYEGEISVTRILEKSSNVGMVYISQKLTNTLLYEYLKKFGFGEASGIDLQGENPGYLRPKNSWYPIDYST
ncbi:penicillin-binding protein 2, partial [Candidatus Roizmanbacteria bacterium]|nr:penicillin-binding protein 2 [Candidatus Roizmanbacteria bacterium]